MSDDKRRSRFDAVNEELTEDIKPAMKPDPTVAVRPLVPQLFETFIASADGVPAMHNKCGAAAYEPIWVIDGVTAPILFGPSKDRIMKLNCRACPLPSPILTCDQDVAFKVSRYKCCVCSKTSNITLMIDQVNLWCTGCKRLAIHDNDDKTRRESLPSGSKLVRPGFAFKDFDPYAFNGPMKEFRNEVSDPKTIGNTAKEWTSTLIGIDGERTVRPATNKELVESFRRQLELVDFVGFALLVRKKNERLAREGMMTWGEVMRRSGRTTVGLISAIAEVVQKQAGVLLVKGGNQANDRILVMEAWSLYARLGLKQGEPLHTVKSSRGQRAVDLAKSSDSVVYIDHHCFEV